MTTKDFRSSLKELNNNKTNKTKLFLTKLKHHRNLSTSIPAHSNISTKKLFSKKEDVEKNVQPRSTLFNISTSSLQQISSYGTNNKSKMNNDTKEKEKDKNNKKKMFISNEVEINKYKDTEKIAKKKVNQKVKKIFYLKLRLKLIMI